MVERPIQEQPESTIGRKPLGEHEAAKPEEVLPPGRSPERFAHARVRHEEAEESEVGSEIRDHEEPGGRFDRGQAEGPAGQWQSQEKPSVP